MPGSKHRTASEYLDTLQNNLNVFDRQSVEKVCKEAVTAHPEDNEIVETVGTICLEFGKTDEAKMLLQKSISLAPNTGYTKYFSMAQLSSGTEAAQYFTKGIEVLEASIDTFNSLVGDLADEKTKQELARTLSNGYTSLGELYMTELCDEDQAEENCTNYLTKALEVDALNPEAYLAMARLKLVRKNTEEAKDLIEKSVNLWFPEYQQKMGDDEFGDVACPLDYAARISTVQALIETELYALAIDIVDTIVDDNDQDAYSVYLLGWCYYLQNEKPESKMYMKLALDIYRLYKTADEATMEHAQELLEEMAEVESTNDDDLSDLLLTSGDERMDEDD